MRLRQEANPANRTGGGLTVEQLRSIEVSVSKAPPLTDEQASTLRRIFMSAADGVKRGTGQCLICKASMVYDAKAKRWTGADGDLVCDATAINVRRHQR